jgi:hypothetical protein
MSMDGVESALGYLCMAQERYVLEQEGMSRDPRERAKELSTLLMRTMQDVDRAIDALEEGEV